CGEPQPRRGAWRSAGLLPGGPMTADRVSRGSPLPGEGHAESSADGLPGEGHAESSADGPQLGTKQAPQRAKLASKSERPRAKLCLKARPTAAQLADRLRPVDGVWPDGVELYLAAADLTSGEMVDTIAKRVLDQEVPSDFAWLIEGPVDSL